MELGTKQGQLPPHTGSFLAGESSAGRGLKLIPDRAEPSLFNYRMILAMESTARASSGSVPLRDADGVVSRLTVAWKAPKVNGG